MALINLFAGMLLLYLGAEGLVRGSSHLALRMGIKPMVVGLTIVAFGTSFPELVVSVNASLRSLGDLSIGNVIGSNIFNIAVILGVAACIRPLTVEVEILRRDAPLMVVFSVVYVVLLFDTVISRTDALLLLTMFVVYMVWLLVNSRSHKSDSAASHSSVQQKVLFSIVNVVAGLAALVAGAHLFTLGGVAIAEWFNVPQAVIGLTIIAAGTSLPELATTILATVKKETDIAIGNVIGSNIFNVLAIIGVSGAIAPIKTAKIATLDLGVMVGTAVLLLPFMRTGFTLNRAEGVVLVGSYAAYITLLLLR